jgi:hypothetical protein
MMPEVIYAGMFQDTNLARSRKVSDFQAQAPRPPRSHYAKGSNDGEVFNSGDVVRLTGIYEVLHDGHHREAHEVVMHVGDLFPACDTCDQKVRFKVIRTAPYIFDDEDFEPES